MAIVKWKNVPGYKKYYSEEAYRLAKWSLEINNRKKALRMKEIADEMEDKKRKNTDTSYLFTDDLRPYISLGRISLALKNVGDNNE